MTTTATPTPSTSTPSADEVERYTEALDVIRAARAELGLPDSAKMEDIFWAALRRVAALRAMPAQSSDGLGLTNEETWAIESALERQGVSPERAKTILATLRAQAATTPAQSDAVSTGAAVGFNPAEGLSSPVQSVPAPSPAPHMQNATDPASVGNRSEASRNDAGRTWGGLSEHVVRAGIDACPMFVANEILERGGRVSLDYDQVAAIYNAMADAQQAATAPVTPASEAAIRADELADQLHALGYDDVFSAIAAATHVSGGHVAISVISFIAALRARSTVQAEPASEAFQARVDKWLIACFGETIARDRNERNHRFIEEALELVQANGCTRSEAHQLVDYVYGRPAGELHQEVGGVMNTLAALCLASGVDLNDAAETELTRVWTKVEKIRAKQAAKPKHSPLPGPAPQPPARVDAGEVLRSIEWEDNHLGNPCCPACKKPKYPGGVMSNEIGQHAPDCALARAIAGSEGEGFRQQPASNQACETLKRDGERREAGRG